MQELTRIWHAFWLAFCDQFSLYFGYRAAALSFYTLVSLIPVFIVVTTVITFFPMDSHVFNEMIGRVMPNIPLDFQVLMEKINNMLKQKRNLYGVISFLVAYFFASRLFLALHRTLRVVVGKPGVVSEHILVQVLAMPIFILILYLVYFGGGGLGFVLEAVSYFHNDYFQLSFSLFSMIINIANIITFITFFSLVAFIYHFLVPRDSRDLWNTVIVTMVISTIFTLQKNIFGWVFFWMSRINPIYGAFGGVFGFLVWLFVSYLIILIGARMIYYLDVSLN